MFLAMPRLRSNWLKRVSPKNASRMMSRLHQSPNASRAWAIPQFMSSKRLRLTAVIVTERSGCSKQPVSTSSPALEREIPEPGPGEVRIKVKALFRHRTRFPGHAGVQCAEQHSDDREVLPWNVHDAEGRGECGPARVPVGVRRRLCTHTAEGYVPRSLRSAAASRRLSGGSPDARSVS